MASTPSQEHVPELQVHSMSRVEAPGGDSQCVSLTSMFLSLSSPNPFTLSEKQWKQYPQVRINKNKQKAYPWVGIKISRLGRRDCPFFQISLMDKCRREERTGVHIQSLSKRRRSALLSRLCSGSLSCTGKKTGKHCPCPGALSPSGAADRTNSPTPEPVRRL
uniref:Uncharacterized protein n=1 Tax=Myotis myotis TaxID=51298 RepID=A0A7J7XHK2_MYOMY|nr:hypothetical protein mMyoMyo1_011747 [Myotis myotis]